MENNFFIYFLFIFFFTYYFFIEKNIRLYYTMLKKRNNLTNIRRNSNKNKTKKNVEKIVKKKSSNNVKNNVKKNVKKVVKKKSSNNVKRNVKRITKHKKRVKKKNSNKKTKKMVGGRGKFLHEFQPNEQRQILDCISKVNDYLISKNIFFYGYTFKYEKDHDNINYYINTLNSIEHTVRLFYNFKSIFDDYISKSHSDSGNGLNFAVVDGENALVYREIQQKPVDQQTIADKLGNNNCVVIIHKPQNRNPESSSEHHTQHLITAKVTEVIELSFPNGLLSSAIDDILFQLVVFYIKIVAEENGKYHLTTECMDLGNPSVQCIIHNPEQNLFRITLFTNDKGLGRSCINYRT